MSGSTLADALTEYRTYLWGIGYRMTGTAADADDLVQEVCARALTHPPADLERDLRPWLTKVAINLARDLLRRRKQRSYPGIWLPEPIEVTDELVEAGGFGLGSSPERRYGALETLGYGFLVALEVLSPAQRAVLLLRDGMEFSGRETAEFLDMSEANVKVTLHRARRALRSYDTRRDERSASVDLETARGLLGKVLAAISSGDLHQLGALLAEDVRAQTDGGGFSFAGRVPVVGREKVARMFIKLARAGSSSARFEVREINGAPAIVGVDPDVDPPAAPSYCVRFDFDAQGRVREIHSVTNPYKLARLLSGIVGFALPGDAASSGR